MWYRHSQRNITMWHKEPSCPGSYRIWNSTVSWSILIVSSFLQLKYVISSQPWICQGPIRNAERLTGAICDLWRPMARCHLAPPYSLKTFHIILILPCRQVKPELWISLTSAYELSFECCSHSWIQNDELFNLNLILTILWYFDFWA